MEVQDKINFINDTDLNNKNNDNNNIKVIVVSKSSNTLKNNIDLKNDVQRKRTSLQIIPHHPSIDGNDEKIDLITTTSTNNILPNSEDNQSSDLNLTNNNNGETDLNANSNNDNSNNNNNNDDDDIDNLKNNNEHKILSNRNSIASINSSISNKSMNSSETTGSSSISENFITTEQYHDLENGNCIDNIDSKLLRNKKVFTKRLSTNSTSSDEYILREKLQNIVNESISIKNSTEKMTANDSMQKHMSLPINDGLLSPHEGPIGRRYAEIAQFKNPRWSSDPITPPASATHYLFKSRRLPTFCGIESSNNNNNNNSNNNNDNTGIGDGNDNVDNILSDNIHSNDNSNANKNDQCCDDNNMEDDMQALLPNSRQLSRDELSQSRASLISSSDGGILAEGETSSETTSVCSDSPACDLGLVERLLRTHPVWFLPGIQRAGAVHLLQGKEEGNFIVRGSSQPNTMAVSVRLPLDTGPYIEHYLIQSNEGILNLESSRFKFDSIPALIAHYAQCCDELPVQLLLPRALREAKNRQQLSSLALLGQEFWRYPMANPKLNNEEIKSPNSFTDSNTSGIGMSVFSSKHEKQNYKINNINNNHQTKVFSPTNPLGGMFSQAGTPSDTNSSLSSFTTSTGQNQLLSPESIDSVILTMSPVEAPSNRGTPVGIPSKLSTFKSNINSQPPPQIPFRPSKQTNIEQVVRNQRPTPPNTLNLGLLRVPPAPPVRWSKPLTPLSPAVSTPSGDQHNLSSNNFIVTTTVTFKVDNNNSPQFVEVTSPMTSTPVTSTPNTFQTFSKRLSPEGECKTQGDTLSSQGSSKRWHSQSSKDSNNSQKKMLSSSKGTDTPSSGRQKRIREKRKESKHYKECDILESPQIYCRSALGDKISDYEDLWTQDNQFERNGKMSSFRPELAQMRRPDLLPEPPNVTSLNCNLLSPTNSNSSPSINSSPPINSNNILENVQNSDTDKLILTDEEPEIRKKDFRFSQNAEIHKKNRLGLILPLKEESLKSENETTPTAQTPDNSRSKQGSPFYAEPADALQQAGLSTSILRRTQRNLLIPINHRHSEPPKGGLRNPICPALVSSEIEKIAGSLDQLKKSNTKRSNHNRLDPWPVDSSWEFMIKNESNDEECGDYDTEKNWSHSENLNNNGSPSQNAEKKVKPLTIHQIIANKLPELNLPELIRCSTPQKHVNYIGKENKNENLLDVNFDKFGSNYRMSSYDNVEKTNSFLNSIDSAQSDDGTVFSEPWDSSQWDSFFPHDDNTDTIHLSKCPPALCNSEDDTLIDESITKNNQGTLKANKRRQGQKVATILRSRSCRDREILGHPRNKAHHFGGPGETIRTYTLELAKDPTSTFARNIENFISCTKESREPAPQIVMRNMRQFMNGMKNYLVKHGEADFQQEVEKARSYLKFDEFLNLDQILESVMHKLVVLPLREYLYGLFVDYYTRSNDIQLLAENVKYACGRKPFDFGIPSTVEPPSCMALQRISLLLWRLYEAELPLDKLDYFLSVISIIIESTSCQQLGADELLPILVYVVAKCGFIGAEIEAEFMWGLLQPQLLNGEPGYYLTSLCSAVHVLKMFMSSENEGNGSIDWRSSSMPTCSSVLRVIIPDEYNGSLQTRTLPIRPHTTTKEVCRIIAHKARITNPQDYALFKLVDGEETLLNDTECPQDIRITSKGKHYMLAYKRIDAKIAWPTTTTN